MRRAIRRSSPTATNGRSICWEPTVARYVEGAGADETLVHRRGRRKTALRRPPRPVDHRRSDRTATRRGVSPPGRPRSGRARRSGGVDVEVEARTAACGQAAEDLVGRLDHGAALLAHEVAVGAGRQVVGGRAVPEMGVDHHTQPLEIVEVPVDRGDVHLGRHGLDASAPSSSAVRCPESRRAPAAAGPGARDPSAVLAEQGQGPLDAVDAGHHRLGGGELLVTAPSYVLTL